MDEKIDNGSSEKLNFSAWDGTAPMEQVVTVEKANPTSNFDEREYFKREIKPLIESMVEKCQARDIPLLCHIAIGHDEKNGSPIYSVGILPGIRTPMSFRVITELMKDKSHRLLKLIITSFAACNMMDAIADTAEDGENKQ